MLPPTQCVPSPIPEGGHAVQAKQGQGPNQGDWGQGRGSKTITTGTGRATTTGQRGFSAGEPIQLDGQTDGGGLGVGKPLREQRATVIESGEEGVSVLDRAQFNMELKDIYEEVARIGGYNYTGARRRVPSGLNVAAWREHLRGYRDPNLVEFLEFGWPVNCQGCESLVSTDHNHPSATNFAGDIEFYIETERGHGALAGPFRCPPPEGVQLNPLMTRPKRDAAHRRVIMDLSWPQGGAVNDGISSNVYVDGPANIKLPTSDYREGRLLMLGRGAFMYKSDLARGYRQLRVDPLDWPLLGFSYGGVFFLDICPPFGLRTAAMCMQRTSEAISYIHGKRGYLSRPYLDDFGGAERTEAGAQGALQQLQSIMRELGVVEALHKVCQPAQEMVWLGILYNSVDMRMSIPGPKLEEIMQTLQSWEGRVRATRQEMQSLLGLLQFVASVTPPARLFTNRMLQNLREAPKRGAESLSLGFKKDLKFFLDLLPHYNGVRIIDKESIQFQEELELDACLSGCGAFNGTQYYAEQFPTDVVEEGHTIAHLELLNIVVAIKVWADKWRGKKVKVHCDNSNACLAMQTGRSRDNFVQKCVRVIFLFAGRYDMDVTVVHIPGRLLVRADALSRMHTEQKYRVRVARDPRLRVARRVRVPDRLFGLRNEL